MIKKYLTVLITAAFMAIIITGCSSTKNNADNKTPETENNVNNTDNGADTNKEDPNVQTNGNNNQNLITEDRAKEIALEHAKLKGDDVTFLTAKLEMDDGIQVYEVDFYTADREYDYEIDAVTGDVLSHNYEAKGNNENRNNNNTNADSKIISEDEAKQAALNKVKGASDKDIDIWLDTDDGVQSYEGKILYNNKKYEFEIDAVTGNVVEWEEEAVK